MVVVCAATSLVDAREPTPTFTSINQLATPLAVDSDDHGVFRNEFKPTKEPEPVVTTVSPLLTALPIDFRIESPPLAATSEPKAPTTLQTTRSVATPTSLTPAPPGHQTDLTSHAPTTSVAIHQTASEVTLDFHRAAHKRLAAERTSITQQLMHAQDELAKIETLLKNERQFYADAHAESVAQAALPSPRGAKVRQLSCHGWKKTNRCRYTGSRRPEMDRSCFTPVAGGAAGYCEVRDAATGESFKTMRVNSSSMPVKTTLWCQLAPQFANFPALIERAIAAVPSTAPESTPGIAIVMVVLSSRLRDAVATIQTLRKLGCELSIELWYFESEMKGRLDELQALTALLVNPRPITTLPYSPQVVKFAKIHAIAHSAFTNVLYLDPLVMPLRDPTYLFKLPEFLSAGTIFWPDLFHPGTTESNIQPSSLLWELLDMPAVRMFEQDDRQLLIRRDAALVQASLRVLEMMSLQRPNLFEKLELVKRGKDLFRFTWLKTSMPFYLVAVPPAIGGRLVAEGETSGRFCGTHVVQHDPSGRMLFVHRHSAGDEPKESAANAEIPHVQTFDWQRDRKLLNAEEMMFYYDVQSFRIAADTSSSSAFNCFAHTSKSTRHQTQRWSDVSEAQRLTAVERQRRK